MKFINILPLMTALITFTILSGCATTPSSEERKLKMPSWFEGFDDDEKPKQAETPKAAEQKPAPKPNPPANTEPKSTIDNQPKVAASVEPASPKQQQQAKSANGKYQVAVQLLQTGQLDAALAEFRTISEQYPALTGPIVNQAIILRTTGQLKQAKKLLQDAMLNKASSTYLLTELGIVNRRLGHFKAAKEAYLAAIRTQPAYAKAHFNLAVLADLYLHDPALAKAEFEAYQSLLPKPDKKVSGWLAEITRRLAKGAP